MINSWRYLLFHHPSRILWLLFSVTYYYSGTVIELWFLNAMGMTGFGGCGGQVTAEPKQLSNRDLWHWLVDHAVPRTKMFRENIKVLFYLNMQKSSKSSEKKSGFSHHTRKPQPLSQFPDLSQVTSRSFKKKSATLYKMYTVYLSPGFCKRTCDYLP